MDLIDGRFTQQRAGSARKTRDGGACGRSSTPSSLRAAEPELTLDLVGLTYDTGAHDIYQLLVLRRDGDVRPRARARERAALDAQAARDAGRDRLPHGRRVRCARPGSRRRPPRLLGAVKHLGRLRRGADPQGLSPARAGGQPGARSPAFPRRARFPQRAGACGVVRVLRRAADRDARPVAGVRRRRRRRLGARARRDRRRAGAVPRPAPPARRSDGAAPQRPRLRSQRRRVLPRGAERRGARALDGNGGRRDRPRLPLAARRR